MSTVGRRSAARGAHIRALDGLRAVAVVAVLAFHAGLRGATGGYLGVSLFFTLSGFLMGSLLLREGESTGRIDLIGFWEQRLRRLAPAALLTLAGVAILAPRLGGDTATEGLRGDALSALGYVANWRFLSDGQSYASVFSAPSPVLHFWSLSIEEQFYVALPLVLLAAALVGRGRRAALVAVLAALAAASAAAQLLVSGYDRAYYGTDTRAAELLAGALLACAVVGREERLRRRPRLTGALALVALGAFVALVVLTPARAPWLVHGGLAGVALLNVALIRGALVPQTAIARGLGITPLVATGRVSYGLYLYHWPVFLWLDESRTQLAGAALLAARVAVTVGIAVVSYHLIECPVRYRRRLVHRPRLAGVLGAALAGSIALAATAPEPVPVRSLFDTDAFAQAQGARHGAALTAYPAPPQLRVMVVGDSTGTVVADSLAPEQDMAVLDATRADCPLLPALVARRFVEDPPRDIRTCADMRSRWPLQAEVFDPDIVLVVGSYEDVGVLLDDRPAATDGGTLVAWYRHLVDEYANITEGLRSTGAVVAWADVPYFTFAEHPDVRADDAVDLRVKLLNIAQTEATARALGTVPLDYARHLNEDNGSIDLTVRPDGIHMTPMYAAAAAKSWLSAAVYQAFDEARAELGLPVADRTGPAPRRVLVVGDSTSLSVATGLANHARAHGGLVVDWAGQVACPLLTAEHFRMFDARALTTEHCEPAPEFWAQRAATFRPDVVVVFSSFMDAMELELDDGHWAHLGQRDYDAAYAAQIDVVIAALAPSGAVVLWSDAPEEGPATGARTGALGGRVRALNALVGQGEARWRHVVRFPLAAHVDGTDAALDKAARPDGIHFTVEAATAMADTWLAAEVAARADQGIAEAGDCRAVTGDRATIVLDACRVAP